MNRLADKRKVVLVACLIAALMGCDDGPNVAENPKDPLAEIDGMLYLMKFEAELQLMVSCMLSEGLKGGSSEQLSVQNPDEQMVRDFQHTQQQECEFWKSVQSHTEPNFEQIVRESTVPEGLYSFSIFELGEEWQYKKIHIGVFTSLEVCEELEAHYRKFGEGTASCQVWTGEPSL